MKKLLLLVVLLAPCVPSFIVGIQSQHQTTEERRQAMLEERFARWLKTQGYDYNTLTEQEKDALYGDAWMEFEDYDNAVDSIDSVLSVKTMLLNNP